MSRTAVEFRDNYYALYYAIFGKRKDHNFDGELFGVTATQALSEFGLVHHICEGHIGKRGLDKKKRKINYITPQRVEEINRLYDSGLTMKQVGEEIGISASAVHANLRNPRKKGWHLRVDGGVFNGMAKKSHSGDGKINK